MGKRTARRPRLESTTKSKTPSHEWQPVKNVGLEAPMNGASQRNHYDDDDAPHSHRPSSSKPRSRRRIPPSDLEADPSEATAIFMSLEVLEDVSAFIVRPHDVKAQSSVTESIEESRAPALEPTVSQRKKKSKRPSKEASKKILTSQQSVAKNVTEIAVSKKSKPSAKTTRAKVAPHVTESSRAEVAPNVTNAAALDRVRDTWRCGGIVWSNAIASTLHALYGVDGAPTPIQSATLAASILGRRNVVGAAPTGSGKTLAFLLPILHDLQERTANAALHALILTPTRELARQIHAVCGPFLQYDDVSYQCGCLTGGLAVAKQARVLHQRPAILIATPGRLWELISSRQYEHLNDLSQIRFLVIDEADRMVISDTTGKTAGFGELHRILEAVQRANPEPEDDFDDEDDEDETPRLRGLPGFPGEARVEMLPDSIPAPLQPVDEPNDSGSVDGENDLPPTADDEQDIYIGFDETNEDPFGAVDNDMETAFDVVPRVHRQTFVFSATLALPHETRHASPKPRRDTAWKNVGGAIAEILQKSRAVGPTKVVDLTHAAATEPGRSLPTLKQAKSQFQLPPGLQLQQIKCTQLHKDSHLYAYLKTTASGTAGPALIFCNSVAAVRRVGATLSTLGLPVRMLHAQMQQRSRFKAIESLQGTDPSKSHVVVVATDVAARGLDIPSVATVVHYDAARTMETFVHRSGRTARGMGDGAVGSSLSLVASGEDKFHTKIAKALNLSFADVVMDGRLLSGAQERVNLASKVASVEDTERKTQRDNQWFKDQAAEAGLDVDDDLLTEGLTSGSSKDKARWNEAQRARERLRLLLSQPMQTQRFGKFLSTNSAASQRVVAPTTVPTSKRPKKKRRRT